MKELLLLENQICFKIYSAEREITKLYRELLDEIGLTYPQYLAMLVLWEKGTVTVKELGTHLFLDSGTLTPMLKRMEANGLVERRRSVEDGWIRHSSNLLPDLSARRLRPRLFCLCPRRDQHGLRSLCSPCTKGFQATCRL